jgi:hypothetical protein
MEFLGFALVIIGIGLLLTGLDFGLNGIFRKGALTPRLKTFVIVALNCARALYGPAGPDVRQCAGANRAERGYCNLYVISALIPQPEFRTRAESVPNHSFNTDQQ